ncbi:Hypothetical protein CINCED_3A019487, partial [Cinara cedri]
EESQGESYENPNDTLEHMRYPVSPTVHLGYNSIAEGGDRVFTLEKDNDKIKDGNCNSIKLKDMKGWKIYIKILDRYYFDNAGGYALEFLSGVNNSDKNTVFDYVYNYLKCTLLIYSDKGCEISSLLYLFGMVQETKQDMLIRMMKITLVVVLISPGKKDIMVDKKCDKKDLVRLANSLSHALDKFEIMLLVHSIDKKIDINSRVTGLCAKGNGKCVDYVAIMNDYKNGIVHPDLKREVKAFVHEVIMEGEGCRLVTLGEKYKEDGDYQRVQDIKRSILINVKEIFILFLLSFLMFSMRKFVQELGSNFAGGGYSLYSISSMYQGAGILSRITFKLGGQERSLMQLLKTPNHLIGMKLDVFGQWAGHLPNELAKGAAHLLGRTPLAGGILKYAFEAPRKLVNVSVEATKFITSPKDNVDHFEKKIYKAFGVDERDITYNKFDRYLSYFKGYVSSHLGYTLEDAVKFTWEHGTNSIGHAGSQNKKTKPYTENIDYKDDLLYIAKVHRKDFLDKLYGYTIGKKVMPGKSKADENPCNKPNNVPPNKPRSYEDLQKRPSLDDAEAKRKRAEEEKKRRRDEKMSGHDEGNIKLSDYNNVINARRARIDMLLDNIQSDDINFIKLNEALHEKLIGDQELFDAEDEKIAQEKSKIFSILNNLSDLSRIESKDLLTVSLLLSDLSYVEKNIVLQDLSELKSLFDEKKVSVK